MMDGFLALSPLLRLEERRAPVDIFFRTLAETHGPRAVSVVLSGTGADGSMGMKRVKECGGVCFVQDPDGSRIRRHAARLHRHRPGRSGAAGGGDPGADHRVSTDASGRSGCPPGRDEPVESDEVGLREIFNLLRQRTGHDFINYKRSTVLRRIERRLAVHGIHDIRRYAQFLRDHPAEAQAAAEGSADQRHQLLPRPRTRSRSSSTASFPQLFEGKTRQRSRARVGAGLRDRRGSVFVGDAAGRAQRRHWPGAPTIQLFATDIDETAIATAREGVYTINDAADVSADRLERFFIKDGGMSTACARSCGTWCCSRTTT